MPEWTPAQKKAIESRNGTILVSAAAGSGKTAVLVERVIQRIEDEKNPCAADSLLVVTFTKAAAAQMKEKITSALDKRIEENPENQYLQKQRMLLPFASICTIDSFCGDLVKENFYQLGISPDFKISEGTERLLMIYDAVEKVLEKAYKDNRSSFSSLLQIMYSSSDDTPLKNLIISLYSSSRAYAQPDKWLDSLSEQYKNAENFKATKWGEYIIKNTIELYDYHIKKLEYVKSRFNAEMESKNGVIFSELISFLKDYISLMNNGSWEEIVEFKENFSPGRILNEKKYGEYEIAKQIRANAVADIKDSFSLLYCTDDEYKDDIEFLYPVVKEIVYLVKEFECEFTKIKQSGDFADFSDIASYTLKLLVKEIDENGNPVKTELAQSLSESFSEILVDEFQDINEQQNLLFKALSRNESNLFMVGDVKQSIYKFRLAMPDIFINYKKSMPDYINHNYPAKINLDYNFRSRKGVTDFANFIFSQIMNEKTGDIDYNENEELKPKANYNPSDSSCAEIHILEENKQIKSVEYDALYVADYIDKSLKSGLTVKDGEGVKKAEYRDFCILLKNTKDKADKYVNALKNKGIPCYCENTQGFFKATEIQTILSLMRIIDNPLQDIPLVSSMISPIFGFTPDELSEMRNNYRNGPYWFCLKKSAENGKRKSKAFIEEIKRLRNLSVTLGAGEFVRELLDSTGYLSIVKAMSNGSQRAANLSLLQEYADKYENSGHIGLSGFIRFIDRVEKNKDDFEVAKEISENANVVRIMTVHKSKGLEFPICILANCSQSFFKQHTTGNCDFLMKMGIGFKRIDNERKFDTLPYSAIINAHTLENLSEDIRLLYVALTRAKEKMVCILRYPKPEETIIKTMISLDNERKISPVNIMRCKSFSDLILMSCLRHFNSNDLPCVSANRTVKTLNCDSDILFKIIYADEFECSENTLSDDVIEADEDIVKFIKDRVEYEYPYADLSTFVAKVSPSQLENKENVTDYYARAKPSFMKDSDLSSASKGTAIHKFLEFYNFYDDMSDVNTQAQQMLSDNKLSPAEEKLLDYNSLSFLVNSDIAQRIKKSDILEREKKITVAVNANEIYNCNYDDEKIIVQGYIDCAFIENGCWVIVDYKTDRVKDISVLKSRYGPQLKMYEKALNECTGIPVKETVIYSLHLNKKIII